MIEDLESEYDFKSLRDTKDTHEIWYYNKPKGIFEPNAEVIIKTILEGEFGLGFSRNDKIEFLNHIEDRNRFHREDFNPRIEWIAASNCMLNLRDCSTAAFSPDFLCTNYIPVKYSDEYATGNIADFFRCVERRNGIYKNCQCPKIIKFLYDIVEPKDVEILLDYMAYCLWRNYKFANVLILNGYGLNGKSIFMNLIRCFFGEHNVSGESLDRLLNRTFSIASVYNKLVNIDADVSGDMMIENTGIIKKLTGNDLSPAEFKFKPIFMFQNYAKFILSCNTIPKTNDTTDALIRRLIIVNFVRTFYDEKDPVTGAMKSNPNILEEITTDGELSGLLHELLGRLPRIIKQGIRPTTNETLRQTYDKYMISADPVQFFADSALTRTNENMVSVQMMYDSYLLFGHAHGLVIWSQSAFNHRLKEMGFRKENHMVNRVREYYWMNVEIKDWKAIEDSNQESLTGFLNDDDDQQ
jgi:P4 family phage/plasmid primase-like protien